MKQKWTRATALLVIITGLAACGSQDEVPKGQVVARVGGQDVTLSELNAELLANNLNQKGDNKVVAQTALQRIIARKLLAGVAREQELDKNSEYVLARQRSEEHELAGLAQRQMMSHVKAPTKAEAEKYILNNPVIFNNRQLMILEQIRFVQPANANDVKFIEKASSLDEVAELLKQNAIRFERVPTVFDTTSVSAQLASRIDKLPPGEVFVISNGQLVLVNVIREKKPAAIPQEARLQYASQLIRQERTMKAMKEQLDKLKTETKINYQPGYEPTSK